MLANTFDTFRKIQRESIIGYIRSLNTSLDTLFYDVGSLTSEEKRGLSVLTNPEGSILIVSPSKQSEEITNHSPLEFISSQKLKKTPAIDTLVVAGVGSSALGTAALARDVADYIGRPVAGIVSGYGMADIMSEAMGGWFVLGLKNSIRDSAAKMLHSLKMNDHVWDDKSYHSLILEDSATDFNMDRYVYGSPDAAALLLILYHMRDQITLLLGHSKGNYIIENSLEGLISYCSQKQVTPRNDIHIVTLGAVVHFPKQFTRVSQFIGSADYFGMMNSRTRLNPQQVAGAGHTLNSSLPGHMNIEQVLDMAGVK